MATESERALSAARKRRGIAKASITRLATRAAELERKPELTAEDGSMAQNLMKRLDSLNAEFMSHHLAIVDLLEEDAAEGQQAALDENDDRVSALIVRMQCLCNRASASLTRSTGSNPTELISKRLQHLEKEMRTVGDTMKAVPVAEVDSCILQQFEEAFGVIKSQLADVSRQILSFDGDGGDLSEHHTRLSQRLFDECLKIKRLLREKVNTSTRRSTSTAASATTSTPDSTGVKLPKLSVPTFDGNILHWRSFWEQYVVSIHDRTQLSPSEKLAYLKHAVQDGSARHVVEGLSGSGDHYAEAVDCLRKRYDRPRLIHQAHVRAIVDAPPVKDGSGRELRHLHDMVNQHMRALKSMGYDPPSHFITSLIELKLDQGTMFEWQRHSQESSTVPPFDKLLQFINLRAQASESTPTEVPKKRAFDRRRVTSLTADVDESCVVCKTGRHPLYSCQKFKALSHDNMVAVIKSNDLCLNCFKPGHFVRECKSTHRCRKCQKPHHTLLHLEAPPPADTGTHVLTHVAYTCRQCLLMTCRVLIMSPDGRTSQARALLDSASSTSFISERLAQHLHLRRRSRQAQITGIGGLTHQSLGQSVVHFSLALVSLTGEKLEVEAIVLPKVTSDIPTHPIPFSQKWYHLSGINLADPDFGLPGRVDLLLGVDIVSCVLCHGRRSGSSGSPTAFETHFGWVLAGAVDCEQLSFHVVSNHAAVLSTDDLLRRFWEVEELDTKDSSSVKDNILSADEQHVLSHFQREHRRDDFGRFIVPLPWNSEEKPLGESRSLAVRRFLSLERSLQSKDRFQAFSEVIEEYFVMDHAEPVPHSDLEKPCKEVFYLPMHAVIKASSTTTKVRAVFDASVKSSTGVSLNDKLLVGPTISS